MTQTTIGETAHALAVLLDRCPASRLAPVLVSDPRRYLVIHEIEGWIADPSTAPLERLPSARKLAQLLALVEGEDAGSRERLQDAYDRVRAVARDVGSVRPEDLGHARDIERRARLRWSAAWLANETHADHARAREGHEAQLHWSRAWLDHDQIETDQLEIAAMLRRAEDPREATPPRLTLINGGRS